ncbi:MAG: MMPL family transporter [Gammaproteobacteria bacterium]|nr:MMPL family transporter [Gammaproteobacteria bacterium]
MKRFVETISAVVRRWPWWTIVVMLVFTAVLASFARQAKVTSGQEGFAPDTPEIAASEEIRELFSTGSNEQVMQIILSGDDVITAEGAQTVASIESAIRSSDAAAYISDRSDRAGIVSFLGGVRQAAQMQGMDLGSISDEQVKQLYKLSLQHAAAGQADYLRALASTKGNHDEATAPAGLVVVFLDTSAIPNTGDDFSAVVNVEKEIAATAEQHSSGDIDVQAFSMLLLFGDDFDFSAEVGRLFLSAFLIILLILGYVYFVRPRRGRSGWSAIRRTAADVALTLAVILTAIVWMQGFAVLLGPDYLGVIGELNQITQIIPILLIGLGVDYAIHLTGRYREEIGLGKTVADASTRAIGTVGVALILATLTTAVGFLTNLISPIPGLRDFGILTSVGIVAAFLLMLTLLPAIRLLLDRRAERGGRLHAESFVADSTARALPRIAARTAVLAERLPVVTLMVALVLGGLGAYGLTQLKTTFSFIDFLPENSPSVRAFKTVEEQFAGGFGEATNVLIKGDVATPQAYEAMLAAWKQLDDTPDVVSFGGFAAAESPLGVIADLLRSGDQTFLQTAGAAGLGPDLTVGPDSDIAAIFDAAMAAAPEAMGRVLHKDTDGSYTAAQFVIQTGAGEERAAALAENLRRDFTPVTDTGLTAVPTSTSIISAVIVNKLSSSQLRSLFVAILVAMLLLTVNFWFETRRPFLGVITIAPVALVVLWTFGMMALFGISFNPVTATLSAMAIGIGVPFTIHVTHRFEEDRVRYDDQEEAIRSTARHTGAALAGSAFTTMAGFGILMTSSLRPMQQMGQVTVFALGAALVASVLVLPSMLALWDTWHRKRSTTTFDRERLRAHGHIE